MTPHRLTNAARQARRHALRRDRDQALADGIVDRWRDFVAPLHPTTWVLDVAADDRQQLLRDERDRLRRRR